MQTETNSHGLSRYIPPDTKRLIRKQCGFGCVVCGVAFSMYEHIDPEFCDAKEHDPNKMALLCGSCHDKVTRGFWSKQKIKEALTKPFSITSGKCHDAFDIGSQGVIIWLATNRLTCNDQLDLTIDDQVILSVKKPEETNAPYRISGQFYDDTQNLLFQIDNNEWSGEASNWDIECIGKRITIRKQHRQIALQLFATPPSGIVIEKIDMLYSNCRIVGDQNKLMMIGLSAGVRTGLSLDFTRQDVETNAIIIKDNNFSFKPLRAVPLPQDIHQPNLPIVSQIKVGRNDPCPCGSNLKFKNCHGTDT
jgi:hypothetical protein